MAVTNNANPLIPAFPTRTSSSGLVMSTSGIRAIRSIVIYKFTRIFQVKLVTMFD